MLRVEVIYKEHLVDHEMLTKLRDRLPGIVANALDVPGGRAAHLVTERVLVCFRSAGFYDVCRALNIYVTAKENPCREQSLHQRAAKVWADVKELTKIAHPGFVRIYLAQTGVGENEADQAT